MSDICPVCHASSNRYSDVAGYFYFECSGCGIIHLESARLARIDEGEPVREYRLDYWEMEASAARHRARSAAIVRLAEAIFLCRIPVRNVIDIATGTGFILDEIARYLPGNSASIYGCELFPPPASDRTRSANYIEGTIKTAGRKFDAGLCMEAFEHLTPTMTINLLSELADAANDGACFFINTGLAEFAKKEAPEYVDPVHRGHIICWTVPAIALLCKPFGLTASALPGRNWAFLIEKGTGSPPVENRLYAPLAENLMFLGDGLPGESVLSIAAAEAARGYYHASLIETRTKWALDLCAELDRLKKQTGQK